MNHLTQSLENAAAELGNLFRKPGRIGTDQVETLNGIFHHPYLDGTMNSFTDGVLKSEEGIDDIEEYLNEEELDNHIHKRALVYWEPLWDWCGDLKILSLPIMRL